jgi:hypothetical protein
MDGGKLAQSAARFGLGVLLPAKLLKEQYGGDTAGLGGNRLKALRGLGMDGGKPVQARGSEARAFRIWGSRV